MASLFARCELWARNKHSDGIELSDDRLPVIRARAYALSFARRGR
jgi:hypothetical protein